MTYDSHASNVTPTRSLYDLQTLIRDSWNPWRLRHPWAHAPNFTTKYPPLTWQRVWNKLTTSTSRTMTGSLSTRHQHYIQPFRMALPVWCHLPAKSSTSLRWSQSQLRSSFLLPHFPGTSGFLYFYTPPNGLLIGSELRFRITSSNDPYVFKDGQDLIAPDGTTWRIPLLTLCQRRLLYGLYQQAQLDGFIPKILVPRLRNLTERCLVNRRSILLHSLRQSYIL